MNTAPSNTGKRKDSWLTNPSINPFTIWLCPTSASSPTTENTKAEDLSQELKTSAEIGQSVLLQYRLLLDEHSHLQSTLSNTTSEYSKEIQKLKQETEELKRISSFWRERYEKTQNELIKTETTLHSLQIDFKENKKPEKRVIEKIEDREDENLITVEYEKKLLHSQSKIEELEKILQMKDMNSVSNTDYYELKKLYDSATKKNEKNEKTIKELQTELANVQKQMNEGDALVSVVKEMSEANTRYQSELNEAKRLLNESQDELNTLRSQSMEFNLPVVDDQSIFATPNQELFNTPRVKSVFGELALSIQASMSKETSGRESPVSPTLRKSSEKRKQLPSSSRVETPEPTPKPARTLSDPVRFALDEQQKNSITLLSSLLAHSFQRIASTNTLALNRRLRKTFDLPSLTELSNSILEHILKDIADIPSNFPDDEELVMLINITVNLLKEIINLRKRLNEIETAYYTKLEDLSKADVERMKQKYLLQRQLSQSSVSSSLRRSVSSSAWLRFTGSSRSVSRPRSAAVLNENIPENVLPPSGSRGNSTDDKDQKLCKLQ